MKTSRSKKFWAVILTLALLMSTMTAYAFAEGESAGNTENIGTETQNSEMGGGFTQYP